MGERRLCFFGFFLTDNAAALSAASATGTGGMGNLSLGAFRNCQIRMPAELAAMAIDAHFLAIKDVFERD
ncbi:MAG TPA: hypothetical protein PLQ54_20015, partial [Armatimonadota bacterium]|nr:hypothetical protein [Armatimonadota bacterium]